MHFEQFWVSMLITVYFKRKLLSEELRDAIIYVYKEKWQISPKTICQNHSSRFYRGPLSSLVTGSLLDSDDRYEFHLVKQALNPVRKLVMPIAFMPCSSIILGHVWLHWSAHSLIRLFISPLVVYIVPSRIKKIYSGQMKLLVQYQLDFSVFCDLLIWNIWQQDLSSNSWRVIKSDLQ